MLKRLLHDHCGGAVKKARCSWRRKAGGQGLCFCAFVTVENFATR